MDKESKGPERFDWSVPWERSAREAYLNRERIFFARN